MRFCLIHIDDDGASDEVTVIVPGSAERTAILLPLSGLSRFLPLLDEATSDLGEQRCSACAAELPGLRRAGDDAW